MCVCVQSHVAAAVVTTSTTASEASSSVPEEPAPEEAVPEVSVAEVSEVSAVSVSAGVEEQSDVKPAEDDNDDDDGEAEDDKDVAVDTEAEPVSCHGDDEVPVVQETAVAAAAVSDDVMSRDSETLTVDDTAMTPASCDDTTVITPTVVDEPSESVSAEDENVTTTADDTVVAMETADDVVAMETEADDDVTDESSSQQTRPELKYQYSEGLSVCVISTSK